MDVRTVIFPEILGRVAKLNDTRLMGRGNTTREVVFDICEQHPVLRPHLFYANGHFKEHFLVTSAGSLVDLDSPLESRDEIEIMLATSGGVDVDQLTNAEVQRYVRHITLPGVGREGQARLKKARVLIIGTGGLGSPISLYLAAAGIGTIGLVDFDTVEVSNLQRQIVHGHQTIGVPKVESAKRRLLDLNPHIDIRTHAYAVDKSNAYDLIEQYDVVVDGTDNFASRYVVNEACARQAKPLIYGALYRFDGQVSVFNLAGGPCYRCLFPKSPPPELAPSCNAGGVIGVLPGVIGLLQATEAIKFIMGLGKPLSGRLLRFDALGLAFSEVAFARRDDCPTCSGGVRGDIDEDVSVCQTSGVAATRMEPHCYIAPAELDALMRAGTSGVRLIDVRDANELEVCRLPEALHIPLAELDENLGGLQRSDRYVVVCYAGTRAERAASSMLASGFAKVQVLDGGIRRWAKDVERDMPMY